VGAFVIVLREAFEASLVVGLILAFLTKTGRREEHEAAVWQGVAAAVVVSAIMGAILFATVGDLHGTAEMLFEGIAMLVACVVLTSMVFWMRRQAATIGGELREKVGTAVKQGGGLALASVAFVACAREGFESALFLFVSVGDSGLVQTIVGGALGLATAVALGVFFYRGSLRLDLRRFFLVTGLLVIVFAAYLLYGALHELGEAGGGEALEVAGPIAAIAFAIGVGILYTRPTRRPRRAEQSDQAATQAA
jgi:high-affinity iron transporter